VRNSLQLIARSPLSYQLGDPADSRGQAIGLLGQNLAQSVSAGGYDQAFIALGAALIVGIDRKATEPMPTDVEGHSQCGLTIITNERSQPDGTWLGLITDPRDGGVYRAKLWLDEQGNLRLRGFIGIPALGSTQTWHRFSGRLTDACGLA
jgi:uncharacterized protein (DUF2147 family)